MARTYPSHNVEPLYLDALGKHDPIESMRKAPKRLRKLIKGLSKKELARRSATGKWSVKEVLAHLADGEMVFGTRLRFVVAMERPVITAYDQDAFVAQLNYAEVSSADLWDSFAALRAMNVALLERMPDSAFARVGLHTERGEDALVAMLFRAAGHDRLHEAQIERVLATPKAKPKVRDAKVAKRGRAKHKSAKAKRSK